MLEIALTVMMLAFGWQCWRALRWMYLDTIDDIRWYRSQNRCRYCSARLDPEWAALEVDLANHREQDRE